MDELSAQEYLEDADLKISKGNYSSAIFLINQVLKDFPSNKRALTLQAKYYDQSGQQNTNPIPPLPSKKSSKSVDRFIKEIQGHAGIWQNVVGYKTYDASEGKYGILSLSIEEKIKGFLENNNIRLYSHQVELFEKISSGLDVIISTPTASGKTFSFSLPIFNNLIKNKNNRAIFIYPTKALINDQLKALNELENQVEIELYCKKYDGDTSQGEREWNLKNSRIILTNPDMIHYHLKDPIFLDYLKNVQYIVIDEAHVYRGIFGTNVSFLMRRIRRLCKTFGNNPQFILATATLGNPLQFSEWLIGKKFCLVDKSGSPKGEKHIILYNPLHNNPTNYKESSSKILIRCILNNLQTLCFSISRIDAEAIRERSLELLDQKESRVGKGENSVIISYRGGYSPKERIQLETKLKNREVMGCSTTNALEVGIDVGSLDVVIISGYPGSIISTWQQFGRAGRSNISSVGILVAKPDAVDQLFVSNPDYFFQLENEDAIIAGKNPYIKYSHLCCAANESPLNIEKDTQFFETLNIDATRDLLIQNELKELGGNLYYSGDSDPADKVNLRNCSQETFVLTCNGKRIETMDKLQAYREGYKEAIILHQGTKYLVNNIDLQKRLIEVDEVNVPYYTRSMRHIEARIVNLEDSCVINDIGINFGELKIIERVFKFKKIIDDKIIGMGSVDLPDLIYNTKGIWITFPDDIYENICSEYIKKNQKISQGQEQPKCPDFTFGLNGVKNSILPVFSTHVKADIRDIDGLCDKDHKDTGSATIFFYDTVEGGIGFSEYAFLKLDKILIRAIDRILTCDCLEGCLGCVLSHKFSENLGIDKDLSILIANWLQKQIDIHGEFEELFKNNSSIKRKILFNSLQIVSNEEICYDPQITNLIAQSRTYSFQNEKIKAIPNIFPEIEKIVCEGLLYDSINEYIRDNENAIIAVKSILDTNIQPYSQHQMQLAYVLLYYPFYIETLSRELSAISKYLTYQNLASSIEVNIFCCGPAPEFFGLIHFFNSFSGKDSSLNVHLFERENWEYTRMLCISHLKPLLWSDNAIYVTQIPHTGFDFFSLNSSLTYEKYPSLGLGKIHIFQNCLRDLKIVSGSNQKVLETISYFLANMDKGSTAIFIDLNYSEIQAIMYGIREIVINDPDFIILRENIYPILFYNNIYRRSEILEQFLKEKIYSGNIKRKTKYRSLVIGKI